MAIRELGTVKEDHLAEVLKRYRLVSPDSKAPVKEQLERLWREAIELARDPALPVHLGELFNPAMDAFTSLLLWGPNLGDAMANAQRHWGRQPTLGRISETKIEDRGPVVAWHYRITQPGGGCRQDSEFAICRALSFMRGITIAQLRPQRVLLQGEAPPYRAELERILQAPVEFRQPTNSLLFSRDVLALPVMSSPAQRSMIARLAEQALETPPPTGRLPEFLLDLIKTNLADGTFNMTAIAPRLGMSPRTLQRHLQKDQTSFQAVLDQARKELSVNILRHGRQPYARIATRLGYSNVANFHRAFRRWFGQTPNQLRLRLMEQSDLDPSAPRPWPLHTGDQDS